MAKIELIACSVLRGVFGGRCKELRVEQCALVHTVACESGRIVANMCDQLYAIKTSGPIFADFCSKLEFLPRALNLSRTCNIWISAGCTSLPAPSLDVCNIAVFWPGGAMDARHTEY
jgi:hypothetical protein